MEITNVRITLTEDGGERLLAFASITLDGCFVVRDLKIIDGPEGLFVAMPSRKLTGHCQHCGGKNILRSAYCNQCGARQTEDRVAKVDDRRATLYADIAHPINSPCREMIQERVLAAYRRDLNLAKTSAYAARTDEAHGGNHDKLGAPVSSPSFLCHEL